MQFTCSFQPPQSLASPTLPSLEGTQPLDFPILDNLDLLPLSHKVQKLPPSILPLSILEGIQTQPEPSVLSKRSLEPLVRLKDSFTFAVESIEEQIFTASTDFVEFCRPIELDRFYGITEEPSELVSFNKANSHPKWHEAMQSKKDSILKNDTWELYDVPL